MTNEFSTEIQLTCNITFSNSPSVVSVVNHLEILIGTIHGVKKKGSTSCVVMLLAGIKLISPCQCLKTCSTDKYSCGLL